MVMKPSWTTSFEEMNRLTKPACSEEVAGDGLLFCRMGQRPVDRTASGLSQVL